MTEEQRAIPFQEIMAAGAATGEVKTVTPGAYGDRHFILVPDGYTAEEVKFNFDEFSPTPVRNKGKIHVSTADSFKRFVERELVAGTTVCFADIERSIFEVVFNYTGAGGTPGWGDRRLVFQLTRDTKWLRWIGSNNKKMPQLSFADFIDANIEDIISPAAADIIELTKQLKIHKKAEFSSVVDPNTGFTNLSFSETISGETVKGNFDGIGKVELGLVPFRGMAPYKVNANIRFSVDDDSNRLLIHYSMINADIVSEHAFKAVLDDIKQFMSSIGVPIFDV